MDLKFFYHKIKNAVQEHGLTNPTSHLLSTHFLIFLDEILSQEMDGDTCMTSMTIIFEGLYRAIPEDSVFKIQLQRIRLQRWASHYGMPTISFLLTFNTEIKSTSISLRNSLSHKPWLITKNQLEIKNDGLLNQHIGIQEQDENEFQRTCNPIGGFTIGPVDPISKQFIDYIETLSDKNGVVLEIGAAFGHVSLKAVKNGVKVFCNDIDPQNLAIVRNRYLKEFGQVTINNLDQLVFLPGAFPDECELLPESFFDAVLICRVLHFFTGDQIEKSLKRLFHHLKPGGKLFIVCETPYLKNWKKFIPVYEARVKNQMKWPGEIQNPMMYESSGRSSYLPPFVHWITDDIIARSLQDAGFDIDYLSYINRKNQFPDDLILDGRESIGAIAVKPEHTDLFRNIKENN